MVLDYVFQDFFRKAESAGIKAMLCQLFFYQVLTCYINLFLYHISRNLDHFHPVSESRVYGRYVIGSGYEKNL